MTSEKIEEVVRLFAAEAREIYGNKLNRIILYGSCARGDFEADSDIDLLILLDVDQKQLTFERSKITDLSDRLDLDYDVVLAPVFQNVQMFDQYSPVSVFYQNIRKEGVQIA